MSKHTPGPWLAIVDPNTKPHTAMVDTGAIGERVMAIDCDRSGCSPSVDIANATLIAAAPELLEALKLALNVMETVATEHGYDTSIGAVPQARAAIAKAEGK